MIIVMKTAVIMIKNGFLVFIIFSLIFKPVDASNHVCWQRKYGFLNSMDRDDQSYYTYYNRPYAPYPYYRGAFIP